MTSFYHETQKSDKYLFCNSIGTRISEINSNFILTCLSRLLNRYSNHIRFTTSFRIRILSKTKQLAVTVLGNLTHHIRLITIRIETTEETRSKRGWVKAPIDSDTTEIDLDDQKG